MPRQKKVKEIIGEIKGEVIPEVKPGSEQVANALEAMGFEVPEELLKPERITMPDIDIDIPVPTAEVPTDGFDFTALYQREDVIYLVRFIDIVDVTEVKKLTVRTVMPRYMVGTEEKSGAMVIGPDMRHLIFDDPKPAKEYLHTLMQNTKKRTKSVDDEIPEQLQGMDEEEDSSDDISKYMDGDGNSESAGD